MIPLGPVVQGDQRLAQRLAQGAEPVFHMWRHGLVVGVVWGLGHVLNVLAPVVWPLAVAGVVACLLDPVVGFLTRRKVPRARAIVVVFVLALAIVGAVAASIVPQLVV